MRKSLQAIEDYYYRNGLRGDALRKATAHDQGYVEILQNRWSHLTKQFKIKPRDRKRYILSTDQDYEILGKIYQLELLKLSKRDRALVRLIRLQLEHHWRDPLVRFLNRLLRKYER